MINMDLNDKKEDIIMKNYMKPVSLVNEELNEGVYAASGATCFTCRIEHQPGQDTTLGTGEGLWCFRVFVQHLDIKHQGIIKIKVTFDRPVEIVENSTFDPKTAGPNTSFIIERNWGWNGSEPTDTYLKVKSLELPNAQVTAISHE